MASYRPFHPPPHPPPPQNPPPQPPPPPHFSQPWAPPPPPPPHYQSQNTYSLSSNITNNNNNNNNINNNNYQPPPPPPVFVQQQQQPRNPPPPYSYPPPPPEPSSYPPPPPPSIYTPSNAPPPPPSSPPPPPPPSQPVKAVSPPRNVVVKKELNMRPPLPKKGKVETEEERRVRKKREYEKVKHDEKMKQHLKESQNKVLMKTSQMVGSSGSKGHGSVAGGSHLGDTRRTPLLTGEGVENRLKKPTTFICKMKFRNEMPDPSAKMKLLPLPKDPDRYCKYQVTSLEKNWKPQLYVEPDLGIPLDLLDLSVYNPPKGERIPLDPADEELLRDDDPITPIKNDGIQKKERPTDKGVSWLVKTQYISPISTDSTKQAQSEKQARELKESRDRDLLENLNNREMQIQNIENSFEACKSKPVNKENPDLTVKRILPLLPYFDRYDEQFVVAQFDSAPTEDSEIYSKLSVEERDEYERKAVMKSYMASSSEAEQPDKFLAYMVPTVDEVGKDIYDENEDVSYSWIREYHWDVRGDDVDDPNTFLVAFDDSDAKYLPLPTKLMLRKKRARDGKSNKETEPFPVPKSVTIRNRQEVAVLELRDDEEPEDYVAPNAKRRDRMDDSSSRLNRVVQDRDRDADQFSAAEDDEMSD